MLNKKFLKTKAQQLGLTAEQEEVFILKFGEGKSNGDIAGQLGISLNACVQCLGEIYRKAGIEGRSRGKANRLQSELVRELDQRQTPRQVETLHDRLAIFKEESQATLSERQYLQHWLEHIQKRGEELSSEKGWDEVDQALEFFTRNLSATTTALAANSRYKKAEVVQQILQKIGDLFSKIHPPLNQVPGLDFLTKKNALRRSIEAFTNRLIRQLGFEIDNLEAAVQEITGEVLEQGQNVFRSATRKVPHPMLKTYSAWVRRKCLTNLVKRYCTVAGPKHCWQRQPFTEPQQSLMDEKENIARNLKAIDTAILEMYLISRDPSKVNFNFFDILVARWMKAVPWGDESLFPERDMIDHQDDDIYTFEELDVHTFEWAALRSLRNEFHKLDGKSYLELDEIFQHKIKLCEDKYVFHFCDFYKQDEYAIEEKYAIVSIPVSLCKQDMTLGIEMLQDIWSYSKLASYNYLTEENLETLDLLLKKAQQYPILDFWFNEIDHFTAHFLEDLDVLYS